MIKFHVNLNNKTFMNASLEDLPITTRAYNGLRRAGLSTVGDLVNAIDCENDIAKLGRNIGAKSAGEIMKGLYDFYIECLPMEKKAEYVAEVMRRQNDPDYVKGNII